MLVQRFEMIYAPRDIEVEERRAARIGIGFGVKEVS